MSGCCHWVIFVSLAVVGEIDDKTKEIMIFTHRKIDIGYNGNQVMETI